MDSISIHHADLLLSAPFSDSFHHHHHNHHHHHQLPCMLAYPSPPRQRSCLINSHSLNRRIRGLRLSNSDGGYAIHRRFSVSATVSGQINSSPIKARTCIVGDFMTKKGDLHVVRPNTNVDEALETLVEKRITGLPVIEDDWKLVGVVSDYDLLALDSISGGGQADGNMFPDVNSSWKAFNEIQRLLSKTNGKVVGDLMTPVPLVVRETTDLADAVRLLLETKHRRLPVVDDAGRLVGVLTRGDVVRAALQIKRAAGNTDIIYNHDRAEDQ